ncbi:hypothetical protein HPB50_016049 [Hyalomma asiaticum]|uniref:Uncharacterized protein n=1 Tax=Hyalomma asiaticum TaxID=266040 RepID=A0ACB7SAD6_HYAAI|nr:hypothetical protein HPB50_016049 [Hyalomma asiaticum]
MSSERYSFSLTTFSPSGKLVQIEYALAAVAAGAPSVGIKASNGVVLATEKKHKSILYEEHSIHKVEMITNHIGMVYSGMGPDYRLLVRRARKLAQQYHLMYNEPIPTSQLVQKVAYIMQEYTQTGATASCGERGARPQIALGKTRPRSKKDRRGNSAPFRAAIMSPRKAAADVVTAPPTEPRPNCRTGAAGAGSVEPALVVCLCASARCLSATLRKWPVQDVADDTRAPSENAGARALRPWRKTIVPCVAARIAARTFANLLSQGDIIAAHARLRSRWRRPGVSPPVFLAPWTRHMQLLKPLPLAEELSQMLALDATLHLSRSQPNHFRSGSIVTAVSSWQILCSIALEHLG